jgi:hypothetical protein
VVGLKAKGAFSPGQNRIVWPQTMEGKCRKKRAVIKAIRLDAIRERII